MILNCSQGLLLRLKSKQEHFFFFAGGSELSDNL